MGLIETLRTATAGGDHTRWPVAWSSWTASTRTAPCWWYRLARGPPAPPACRARPLFLRPARSPGTRSAR